MIIPGWLLTLGKILTEKAKIQIPLMPLFANLMITIGPFILGVIIGCASAKLKEKINKVAKPLIVFVIFTFLFTIFNVKFFVFTLYTYKIFIISLIPWIGFSLGGIFAHFTKLNRHQVLTVSLETGFQNIGVALLIIIHNFPSPEIDYAMVPLFSIAILTPLPMYLWPGILAAVRAIKKFYDCAGDEQEEQEDAYEYMLKESDKILKEKEKKKIKNQEEV